MYKQSAEVPSRSTLPRLSDQRGGDSSRLEECSVPVYLKAGMNSKGMALQLLTVLVALMKPAEKISKLH